MKRPCLDCGRLVNDATRCPPCDARKSRLREAGRPSRYARGYDSAHYRARMALALTLPDACGYGCGRMLHRDGDWVAAHVVDGDPSAGWVAACRSCNERAKHRVVA